MKTFGEVGTLFLTVAIACLIAGFIVMLLWNELMPEFFGLKTISYWQSVGMYLLCSTLFHSGTKKSS